MEINKIKVNYLQGMKMVGSMIKLQFLVNEIGKSFAWLSLKASGKLEMTEKDLLLINESIENVGRKIVNVRISIDQPNEEGSLAAGDNIVEQMKSLYKSLSMDYLYGYTLGKDKKWFNNRISHSDKYKFKEEEILKMNMAIVEIGNKLLSIELTL